MPPQIPRIPYIPGEDPYEDLRRSNINQRNFPIPPRTYPLTPTPPILTADPNALMFPDLKTGRGTFSGLPMDTTGSAQRPTSTTQLPPSAVYTPERRGIEEMYKMMEQVPQVENFKPSLLRKIGATIVGAGGGPEEAHKFRDAPYLEAMQDWEAKYKPVHDVATLERYTNAINRQGANDVMDYLTQNARSNRKPFTNREGHVMYMDMTTGEVHDTGELADKYTDAELTSMGIDRSLRDRDEESMRNFFFRSDLEAQQQAGRERLQKQRDESAMQRVREREARIGGVPLQQASQQKVAWMSNAKRLSEDPNYKGWIELNTQDGYPDLKDPTEMLGDRLYRLTGGRLGKGPTDEEKNQAEKIWRYLFDNIFTDVQPLRTPAPNLGGPGNRIPTPNQGGVTGRVRVFDDKGVERGTIDRSEIDDLPPGWSIK